MSSLGTFYPIVPASSLGEEYARYGDSGVNKWSEFPAVSNVDMSGHSIINIGNLEADFKQVGNLQVINDATIGNATFVNDIYGDSAVFRELDITETGEIGLGNLRITSEDYPQFETSQPQGGDGMFVLGANEGYGDNLLPNTGNLLGIAVMMNTTANNDFLGDDQYSVNIGFGNRAGRFLYGAIGGFDARPNVQAGFSGGLKFFTKSGGGQQDQFAFRKSGDGGSNALGSGIMGCKMKLQPDGSLLIAQESEIKRASAKLHVDGDIIYDARVITLDSGDLLVNSPPNSMTSIANTTSFRNGYYSIDLEYFLKEENIGGSNTSIVFGSATFFKVALQVDGVSSPYAWEQQQSGEYFTSNNDSKYHIGGIVNINGSSSLDLLYGEINQQGSFINFGNTSSIKMTLAYLGE